MITLDALADEPIWLAWRNEERGGKLTKVPYSPRGGKAESDNPDTWGTRSSARKQARRIVDGLGGGVGVILGIDCDDGAVLGGIDLDTCRSPEGDFEPWAKGVIDRFGSYAEISPSGTGAKVFFLYRGEDLPRVRQIMGDRAQHGRMFKRKAEGDHPPAIELHLSNRYFTVTEEAIGGDELRIVEFGDLEWLLKEAGPAFVGEGAGKARGANGFRRRAGPRDESRSGAAFRIGLRMRRAGADFEEFREAVRDDPETAKWYREKGAANGERELNRIWDKVEVEGVNLDDFRAFMPTHSYIFAPTGEMWPAASVNARIAPVPMLDDAGKPMLDKKGEPVRQAASHWLDANRPVEQMTWAPGEPQIVENRLTSHAGWVERAGVACFNLYRPPAIVRGDGDVARPWLRHLRRIYPAEHRHIVAWLAHRVQRPADKINHALVLGGGQGIGKDTVLEPVKRKRSVKTPV